MQGGEEGPFCAIFQATGPDCSDRRSVIQDLEVVDDFALPGGEAAIGGVQDELVAPPFFAWHRKQSSPFKGGREGIDLVGISQSVGDGFFGYALTTAPQFDLNRMLDVSAIVRAGAGP